MPWLSHWGTHTTCLMTTKEELKWKWKQTVVHGGLGTFLANTFPSQRTGTKKSRNPYTQIVEP
jgi:hypothetical protein